MDHVRARGESGILGDDRERRREIRHRPARRLGGAPAGETDALLAARQAKKASDEVHPVLVEVK